MDEKKIKELDARAAAQIEQLHSGSFGNSRKLNDILYPLLTELGLYDTARALDAFLSGRAQ